MAILSARKKDSRFHKIGSVRTCFKMVAERREPSGFARASFDFALPEDLRWAVKRLALQSVEHCATFNPKRI